MRTLVAIVLALAAITLVATPLTAQDAKARKQPAPKVEPVKEGPVTDANIQTSFRKAQDLFKAKNYDPALKLYQGVYDYAKEVLPLIKFVRVQYEKALNQGSMPQSEKEEIYLKLKRAGQLNAKYESLKDGSLYPLGFIYARKGNQDKAKTYLKEAMETLPFSSSPDSAWMRSKTLLLSLYQLEGEF